MSDAIIRARLGLDTTDWKANAKDSAQDATRLKAAVTEAAAGVALLEKQFRAAGGATSEQKKMLKEYRTELAGLEKDLRTAEAQVKKFNAAGGVTAPPRAPIVPPAPSPGGHGGGTGRAGAMEAGHSVRSIFDMIGAGQSFSQASQMELPRLLQASGKGLGTLIGIEAVTGTVKAIEAAFEHAREEQRAFTNALAGGGIKTSSTASLTKHLDSLAEARDKMMPDDEKPATLGDWTLRQGKNLWRSMAGQQSVEDEQGDNIDALEQRRINISAELARRKSEEVALAHRAAAQGEDAVAIDRERLALRERIAQVQDEKNLDETAQTKIIALLREESLLRERHINQVREQHEAEAQARRELIDDRESGESNPVTRAQRALDEARRKQSATTGGTPEGRAADDAVASAELELDDARRLTAERKAQAELVTKISQMTGPEFEKERARLQGEKRQLMEQAHEGSPTYNPDKAARENIINNLLPQKEAQLHALGRADRQRAFERRRNEIAAQTGVGPTEQIKAIDARLNLNSREQTDNKANEDDPDKAARLTAEAAQLARERREIAFSAQQELTAAQAVTREMADQMTGHGNLAKIETIRVGYEQKIAAAIAAGKNDLAAQYALQGNMAITQAQLAEYRKTPQQHAQERLQAQKDARDIKAMEVQKASKLASARQRYEDDNRVSLPLDPKARQAAIEKAVPGDSQIKPLSSPTVAPSTSLDTAGSSSLFDTTNPFTPFRSFTLPSPMEEMHHPEPHSDGGGFSDLKEHLAAIEKATATMAKNLDLGPGSKWFMDF